MTTHVKRTLGSLLSGILLVFFASQTARAGTTPDFFCDASEVTLNVTSLGQDNLHIWIDFDGREGARNYRSPVGRHHVLERPSCR